MSKPSRVPVDPSAARKITDYICKLIRDLLARHDKLKAEFAELTSLRTRWQGEIEELNRKVTLADPDKSMLDTLSTRRLQVSMCPPRLAELEQKIAEAEEAIAAEYETALRPAVERLCSVEAARVRAEIVKELRPHFNSDAAALHQSVQTPRWIKAAPRLSWYDSIFIPAVDKARKALDRLDHFNLTSDLEKEVAETAVIPTPAAK